MKYLMIFNSRMRQMLGVTNKLHGARTYLSYLSLFTLSRNSFNETIFNTTTIKAHH
jgi:hypothetical protein